MSKYPELCDAVLRNGVTYMNAYSRLNLGWDFDRAVSQPVIPRHKSPLAKKKCARSVRRRQAYKSVALPKRYLGGINDTSPAHIQKLRAAFCDEFIKTGVINTELQSKLKDYADECRAAKKYSGRVCAEHAPRRRGRAATVAGDYRGRDVAQIDGAAARRIADFLRA